MKGVEGAAGTISVVIATRNRAAKVVRAAASVLAQTVRPLEVIVVDDGSTDDSGERLAKLPGVTYVWRPAAGVSAARNFGAGAARGEWLAFLDSDDLWLPGKLAAQMRYHHRHPDIAASQTGEIWIRNGVRVNACKHHEKPSGDIFAPSLERCLVSPSAVMLRRRLFLEAGGFDEELPVCEDYDLWLRLGARIPFGLVDEPLVVKYGGHQDQLSRRYWGMDRFRVRSIDKLLTSAVLADGQRAAAVRVLAHKCAVLAGGARKRGRLGDARSYEELAARHRHG